MHRLLVSIVALVCALVAFALPASASERFLAYDVHLRVAADGELHVRESIRANVEGVEIRRGIFRDFPLRFEDERGTHTVDFEVVAVTRDGEPEPYDTERASGVYRIRIGDPNKRITRGEHTWTIDYRTNRQIRYFDTHDEVYWNATGTGWAFPIDYARVTVELPDGAHVADMDWYTGRLGSTDKNARLVSHVGNTLVFETTKPLFAREGLTVVVGMEKGVMAQASGLKAAGWWLRDHFARLVAALALFLTALWHGVARLRFGGDPPEGVIVPQWELPPGASALRVRIMEDRAVPLDADLMSLCLVELAAHGVLDFETVDSHTTVIVPKPVRPEGLPRELKSLADALYAHQEPIVVGPESASWFAQRVEVARAIVEEWLTRGDVFLRRHAVAVGGALIGLSGFALALTALPSDAAMWLLFLFALASALLVWTPTVLRGLKAQGGFAPWTPLLFHVLLTAVFVGVMSVAYFREGGDFFLVGAGLAMIVLQRLFVPTRRVPTPAGRAMLDEIEGLRRYITLAEADRMNLVGGPGMSVQHFERLLPYAMAMGLEKPWTEQFQTWMQRVGFQPSSGLSAYVVLGSAGRASMSPGLNRGLQSSLARSLTSALPTTNSTRSGLSSSGGGGGSSGGGGGGGGGGGW